SCAVLRALTGLAFRRPAARPLCQFATSILFPYTTLFRSVRHEDEAVAVVGADGVRVARGRDHLQRLADASVGEPLQVIPTARNRSEEHTSELQSRVDLVCRLLAEKIKAPHQLIIVEPTDI